MCITAMNATSIEAVRIVALRAQNIVKREEPVLMDVDNCSSDIYDCTECAIKDGCIRREPCDLDSAPCIQSIWGKFGLTLHLTDIEFSVLTGGGEAARTLIRRKMECGEFVLDGETYFPAMEISQPGVWPVKNEVQFEY